MVCRECGKIIKYSYNGLCQGCYNYFHNGGRIYPLPEAGKVEYDESGKVICHICGRSYNRLGSHIRESHNMTIDEYEMINGKMMEHYRRTENDIKKSAIMTNEQLNTMMYGKPLDLADRVDQTIYLTLTQLYMIAAAIFGMPEFEKAHKRITNNNTILMIKG